MRRTTASCKDSGTLILRGFSVIELLVSISIIAVLMALLLPAVNRARGSARRIQCANNVKNLALAMTGSLTAQRRFPASGYWGGGPTVDKTRAGPHHNWVVELLPWIDRKDLADRWNHSQWRTHPDNMRLSQAHLPVLMCPSDYTTSKQGDLSYALNGGIGESIFHDGEHDVIADPWHVPLDLNGNGVFSGPSDSGAGPTDRQLYFRLGLFFDQTYKFDESPGYKGTVRFHTPATVLDGMSNTLMLAENIKVGYDPYFAIANWSSAHGLRAKVFFDHKVCVGHSCSSVDLHELNYGEDGVNRGRHLAEGQAPWLNSLHDGGVNVAMADGRVQFMSEDIDGRVLFSLFTPQGERLGFPALDVGILRADF